MRRSALSAEEKSIERALLRGAYKRTSSARPGAWAVPYQSLISEMIHQLAA